MTKCAILGAGGHGKVVAEIAELNQFTAIHFFDDRWPSLNYLEHWDVKGNSLMLLDHLDEYDGVFVAIGDNKVRLDKLIELESLDANIPVLVHPTSSVSKYSALGKGSVVMANAVVNPFAMVGKGCIINTSASIDHDCIVQDGVHISPGSHLAGNVEVGCRSWLGIGSQVKQQIKIGNNVIVGAGATVVHDLPNDVVVFGTPAKSV